MSEQGQTALSEADVETEAQALRKMLDSPHSNSDMLYAAYNALLFALGYGVAAPSKMFDFELATAPASTSREAALVEALERDRFARIVADARYRWDHSPDDVDYRIADNIIAALTAKA